MEAINTYFAGGIYGIYVLIVTAIVFYHISLGIVFEKANYPKCLAYIPVYNAIPFIKIAHRPSWWIYIFLFSILIIISSLIFPFWWIKIFLLIPLIFGIIISIDFAEAFDKSAAFGLGIFFLFFIFIPILAYSDAQIITFREKDFQD